MENTFSIEEEEELPVLSKEQLIAEILESTKQAEEGKTISAESLMRELYADTQTEDFIKEFAGCMAADEEVAFNSDRKE